MSMYYHLKAADYEQRFPAALDDLPVMIDRRTYIDDWIFNRMYAIIIEIQNYLIAHKARLER